MFIKIDHRSKASTRQVQFFSVLMPGIGEHIIIVLTSQSLMIHGGEVDHFAAML